MAFDLSPEYKRVPERIADLKAKHPEASLQPADLSKPYTVETIGDRTFIVYVAACYRTPDDSRPGIGIAYEPFPGKTNFTRDSELQNAETSAWGRAIVAALASESKAVASAEDVRNRQADQLAPSSPVEPTLLKGWENLEEQALAHDELRVAISSEEPETQAAMRDFRKAKRFGWPMSRDDLDVLAAELVRLQVGNYRATAGPDPAPPSPEGTDLVERAEQLKLKKAKDAAEDVKLKASGGVL